VPFAPEAFALSTFAAAAFFIGALAIVLRSPVSYSPRMFVPVLSHLIGLTTCFVAFAMRYLAAMNYGQSFRLAIPLCLLLGYMTGNFISRASRQPDTFEMTEEALLGSDDTGHSVKQRLAQELKPSEVIAAANGQAAGYVLKHATLSLVGARTPR